MGNPCAKDNEVDYHNYMIAFLQKLKYLDYKVIDKEARAQAIDKHREDIID